MRLGRGLGYPPRVSIGPRFFIVDCDRCGRAVDHHGSFALDWSHATGCWVAREAICWGCKNVDEPMPAAMCGFFPGQPMAGQAPAGWPPDQIHAGALNYVWDGPKHRVVDLSIEYRRRGLIAICSGRITRMRAIRNGDKFRLTFEIESDEFEFGEGKTGQQ